MAFVINKVKAMKALIVAIFFSSFTMLLFQNCDLTEAQKDFSDGNMTLPNDVQMLKSIHNSFSETSGDFKDYELTVDYQALILNIRFNSCQSQVRLSEQEVSDIKSSVHAILLCQGGGEGTVCTGSCPRNELAFYSPTFQRSNYNGWFSVDKSNQGENSVYVCEGSQRLYDLLKAILARNNSSCSGQADLLF